MRKRKAKNMNAQDFIAAGYRVGSLVSDADIARVKTVVDQSYIAPIVGTVDDTDTDTRAAQMALIFIALTGANAYATRAGGKLKTSPALSERGYASQSDYNNADRLLRVLQSKPDTTQGNVDKIVDDVFGLYMRTYLSM